MLFIILLLIPVIALLAQTFGWHPASFDLDDPEAVRVRYAEITAIESLAEQGRAWCSLTEPELRAIARHTEMSNTITTTTHTSSAGEVETSTVVEPAPNHDELVERAVRFTADSCRYNAWDNLEELQSIVDEEAQGEFLCQLTPEEAATLIRFVMPSGSGRIESEVTRDDGESDKTTVSTPPEPVDESGLSVMLEALSAECGWDGG